MIKIPERPEDVTREQIDCVAKIAGLDRVLVKRHFTHMWFWETKDEKIICTRHFWNPFTKIEHAKMLDGWLIENTCTLDITINKDYNGLIYATVYDGSGEVVAFCISKSEPFARSTSIMKAHQKLEGNDDI